MAEMNTASYTEDQFIFDKNMTCVVCDKPFKTKVLKTSKARRVSSDRDLRPHHAYIDTLKYGICSCPHCGYSALHSAFPHLSSRQIEEIKQHVCAHFLPEDLSGLQIYSYDDAIYFHELAVKSAEAKYAKDGEKAYLYLLLSWLYRGKRETYDTIEGDEEIESIRNESLKEEERYYEMAYEGFSRAIMNESFPIAGLNQPTLEYLLGYMAFHYGKLEVAAKYVSSVLTMSSASRNVKDMALELKDEILTYIRAKKKKQTS